MREWLVELKLYFTRTNTYLSILNFMMIAVIFMNTTMWEYSPIQHFFPDRKTFLLIGFGFVILLTFIIGYLDTKLKFWHTEITRSYAPERSPILIPEAFQSAKMLNDLKAKKIDTTELEANLDALFIQCHLKKEFDFFKRTTKNK